MPMLNEYGTWETEPILELSCPYCDESIDAYESDIPESKPFKGKVKCTNKDCGKTFIAEIDVN